MVHGCPQGKSDNRPDPLTLLYEGLEISQGYHTISRTHYSERSPTRIDRVMVIILYRFTWATFALADHTDCCGRVTGSLEQCLDSHLISSRWLSLVQKVKDRFMPVRVDIWTQRKTYNFELALIAVGVSIGTANRVKNCWTHLRTSWQWFVSSENCGKKVWIINRHLWYCHNWATCRPQCGSQSSFLHRTPSSCWAWDV